MEIHEVPLPSRKNTFKEGLWELFFPDDPFRRFRGQTAFRKAILTLHCLLPICSWASEYDLKLLRSDLIAGLTIASLAIPQGISYAKLASLPPIIGLYSSFVPPLVYAVLGSSRDLAVGPVSIASLVMGSMLREEISPDKEPLLYLQTAFTATFFAGLFQASLGLLRLGFLVDFLSRPTLIGFMGGSTIIVSLQQLKGLLGIVHFTNSTGFVPVMLSVFKHKQEWAWQSVLMGSSFLAMLLIARHIGMRWPRLFWVAAAAPLCSVILSTVLVLAVKGQQHGIKTIGHLQEGVNPPSANMLYFHGGLAVKTGLITGILSLTEGIAVGRTFASLKNYHVDGNKEMIAIGIMNIAGSCTSCYVTTGAFSRSAVNHNAGSKTAMSNVVMAVTVMVTMMFLLPLFYYTPDLVLSAIIVSAVIGLVDLPAAARLWRVDRLDFMACSAAFFGVLFLSVQMGLLIAVGISLLKILIHVTRPNIVMLGNIRGTQSYKNIGHYVHAARVPSFLVLSIESPIYFANSTYLHERVERWVEEEEERSKRMEEEPLRCLILDLSAVATVDSSGVDIMLEMKKSVEKRGIRFVLANPNGEVMQKLHNSKALDLLGSSNGIYMTVAEAISAISPTFKGQP